MGRAGVPAKSLAEPGTAADGGTALVPCLVVQSEVGGSAVPAAELLR
jgi:hypothetical protein